MGNRLWAMGYWLLAAQHRNVEAGDQMAAEGQVGPPCVLAISVQFSPSQR